MGLGGALRRGYDPTEYVHSQATQGWNVISSWSAWLLGLVQIVFIINFFLSIKAGRKVDANPWRATTLEWSAPSPPPHGNFDKPPQAYRDPYDYDPAAPDGFRAQTDPVEA
jgi:cytochrome c oxidase subunit 1